MTPAPIPIPPGDPAFSEFNLMQQPVAQNSRSSLNYTRSKAKVLPSGQREQINAATAWLDASMLYGVGDNISTVIRAGEPRPKTTTLKNLASRVPYNELRLAANPVVNQNPMTLVMATLFMREHNRRAVAIEQQNPLWGDERIFQEARK
eukprot:gene12537-12670_t